MGVFLADLSTFSEMNEAFVRVMGEGSVARITVGGAALALSAAVEIECVAEAPR
jgi:enamine deaminase RidA (YjgF/YER057c/UK114 family)